MRLIRFQPKAVLRTMRIREQPVVELVWRRNRRRAEPSNRRLFRNCEGSALLSHLERVSIIVGTVLVGISAFLVMASRDANRRRRRKNQPPVEELADHLKHAWAGYHTR